MSMRKILRGIAKAKMKRGGVERINRKMSDNWRKIAGARPIDLDTGKRVDVEFQARKKKHGRYEPCRFVYDMRFGPVPPRTKHRKQVS